MQNLCADLEDLESEVLHGAVCGGGHDSAGAAWLSQGLAAFEGQGQKGSGSEAPTIHPACDEGIWFRVERCMKLSGFPLGEKAYGMGCSSRGAAKTRRNQVSD